MGRGGNGRLTLAGALYLGLFGLGVAGPVLLAWRGNLDIEDTAVAGLVSLAPAYIGWLGMRIAWHSLQTARDQAASAVDLAKVAERLAREVKTLWEEEEAVRRVNEPAPLPVAWRAADEGLAEPWDLLTALARAWPGGPPGDPGQWPHSAADLARTDHDIGRVFFDQVPTRRLVILGEPGAGKSVLMIRLLQELMARRNDGFAPVPVLFSLASWDPGQPLKAWLADQLHHHHPDATIAAGNRRSDLARVLLDAGCILPLLDGFDELPPHLHSTALDALNRGLPARQPLVLASRTALYQAAVNRPNAPGVVRLNGAAAIELLPLGPEAAAGYLRRGAAGTPAAARWDAVIARLGTDTPVGRALATPLGLFLARTIYNPRPGNGSATAQVPHPDQLCDSEALPDRASVDAHLFSAFIPAAYTPDQPRPPRWTAEQAHRTMVFLAHHFQHARLDRGRFCPELAWWRLPEAVPRFVRAAAGLPSALLGGLVAGISWDESAWGAVLALVVGLVWAAETVDSASASPATELRWQRADLVAGVLTPTLACGALAWFTVGLAFGPAAGLAVGIPGGIVFGLAITTLDRGLETGRELDSVAGPAMRFALDRRAFVIFGLAGGLAAVSGFGLLAVFIVALGVVFGDDPPNGSFLAALLAIFTGLGTVVGIAIGLRRTAWGHFVIARTYLVARGRVPTDLMGFLQDAHEHRGVLLRVGAVYQFRHIELQRHLARQYGEAGS